VTLGAVYRRSSSSPPEICLQYSNNHGACDAFIPAFATMLNPECGALNGSGVEAEGLTLAVPEGDMEDIMPDELREVEMAGCLLAILAAASSVLIGVPVAQSRNLPALVSQHILVLSQQWSRAIVMSSKSILLFQDHIRRRGTWRRE